MRVEASLLNLFKDVKKGLMPPGDDVDAFEVLGKFVVVNVDGFEAKYVKMEFMTLRDVGWRGLIACMSDLVAKLVRPELFSFSVYGKSFEEVAELSAGVAEAAKEYGLTFLGADTNAGEAAVDAFCMGVADFLPPPLGGARPGDAIVVPEGCWGCVAECLRGKYYEHCRRPRVRTELAERAAEFREFISASTDSSDGLAISLYKMAVLSGSRIVLTDPPPGPLGESGLYGGEEYLPVFAVKKEVAEELAESIGGKVIGYVERGRPAVLYKGTEVRPEGWEWF
ncbi:MAG: hypothetical protein GXO07_00885 [Crenarchaeota archaeon]|nr:hypothetical protein [Thermoproteota archaeon]